MKKINILKTLILLVGVLLLNSCSEETYPETRLFRPVLNGNGLVAKDNTIIVDMGKMKSAVSYKVEVSRDTFKTFIASFETQESKVIVTDLLWRTLYQVRATAIAENPEFNSKISDFGGVTTDKFPSILNTPLPSDVTDVSAKLRWTVVAGDKEVSTVKLFAGTDEALLTPLASYDTTPAEILAGEKIISGLAPGSRYQLAIYSGTTIRGWEFYTTKPAIPTTGAIIDLRGITGNPDLLMSTLKDPATLSGTTIILDGDMTYNATGYKFDKSITIKSGYSINSTGAVINVSSNFDLAPASVISTIIFDGVTITGTISGYVFNIDTSANIENIKFDNCIISSFRGLLRAKSGTGSITNFSINNSIVTDIRDYGILNMDVAGWNFSNVMLTNSTFYKCQKFIVSKSITSSKSILISDCTLNEETALGNKIFVFPATVAGNVTDGITITNTIIGRGWDMAGTATTYGIDPIDGLATTNFFVTNSYATSDYTLTAAGTAIPSFPNAVYGNTMTNLWIDPAMGDFNFKDSSFLGIKNSGDPRWRK